MSPARGLRLSYLRHFINRHGGETNFAGKTTAQVCFEFVVPMTKPAELSLVDHVANDPTTASFVAPANWYVSHAWQYLFLETVDSLERFFADRGLADDAVIWFCVFNNNQHLAHSYPFEYWSSTFKNGLAAIGMVVMIMHPWNDPIVLRRSWCVFEVYVAVTMGARFEIALARDQEATFLDDIADFDAFNKMLATIKSEDSETTVPSDRDGIFDLIRAETSFLAVDRLIFSTLSSWIRTTLEASIVATASLVEKARRWRQLGLIADNLNDYAKSERCFREALTLNDHVHGPLDAETLMLRSLVAFAMGHQRKPRSEWEPLLQSTLALASEHLGETHPYTLATRSNLVKSLGQFGDFAAALPLALDDFERRRSLHGLADLRTANVLSEVGKIYINLAEPRLAMRWLRKAFSIREALSGREHASTMATLSLLVAALIYMGAAAEASELAKNVAASRARTLGAEHPNTLDSRLNVAACMLMTGDAATAVPALLSLQTLFDARPNLAPWLPIVHHDLGIAYAMLDKTDRARTYYVRVFQNVRTKYHAWLLYDFTLRFALTSATEDLALVRDYVESTTDDAPETWPESCMECHRPIIGSSVACAACPHDISKFCIRCRDQRPSRLKRFCRHDLEATRWRRTVPPRRFFYEEALLRSTGMADDYDDVALLFQSYETYCNRHKVLQTERLPRTAMPTLNRGWHPL